MPDGQGSPQVPIPQSALVVQAVFGKAGSPRHCSGFAEQVPPFTQSASSSQFRPSLSPPEHCVSVTQRSPSSAPALHANRQLLGFVAAPPTGSQGHPNSEKPFAEHAYASWGRVTAALVLGAKSDTVPAPEKFKLLCGRQSVDGVPWGPGAP